MDKNLKKKFAAYDSVSSVLLKKGQGHQTLYELVDPKQGYNNAKFEKTCLNIVHEKASEKFLSNQETHQSSPLTMFKSQK